MDTSAAQNVHAPLKTGFVGCELRVHWVVRYKMTDILQMRESPGKSDLPQFSPSCITSNLNCLKTRPTCFALSSHSHHNSSHAIKLHFCEISCKTDQGVVVAQRGRGGYVAQGCLHCLAGSDELNRVLAASGALDNRPGQALGWWYCDSVALP